MTTIRISEHATTPEDAVRELRKSADFIEALTNVPDARVEVTGEMNVIIHYEPVAEPVPVEA